MFKVNFVNGELIVSAISDDLRLKYYFLAACFIILEILVFYLGYHFGGIFFFGFLILLIRFGSVLKRPANWRPVKIRVSEDEVFVNNKALRKEDLIFLSFHQTEECKIIRLEAKRNNILLPNEATILNDCANEDEAIEICRVIRDYIDPELKICYVRLVKGKGFRNAFKSTYTSSNIKFEKRYFID